LDCDGEEYLCRDLVGAQIIEHRLDDAQLAAECYRIVKCKDGVDACMELNLTTGVCHIYYPARPDRETYLHEQNHCRGWKHGHRSFGTYRWRPMPEALHYTIGEHRTDEDCRVRNTLADPG